MNRHPALSFCLSMISAQTLRVCREGKPVPTHRVVARGHAFSGSCSKGSAHAILRSVDLSFALHFLERLARVSEGIDTRGDAAIDGDLKQYLLDLVLGEAVFQGSL